MISLIILCHLFTFSLLYFLALTLKQIIVSVEINKFKKDQSIKLGWKKIKEAVGLHRTNDIKQYKIMHSPSQAQQ